MLRTQARENAFILTFEKIFNPEVSMEEIKEMALACEQFEEDEYTDSLFALTTLKTEELDSAITENARNWSIVRLPKVVLAVLRVALAEILFVEQTPDSVAINEAVELAKKYATEKDASFVNGLLGNVARGKQGTQQNKTDENP